MANLKEISNKFLHSNSLIITYLRSILSSQTASWADYIVCFLLFKLAGMSSFWATAAGAFCGGVINCIINYKFTFRAEGCDWRAVVVKYAVVWLGSLLLNAYGTEAFYNWTRTWQWPAQMGVSTDVVFIASRLFISLMVSWFWNFALQRYVVYRPMPFDKYIIALLGGPKKTEVEK
ncbi:MAG: GtrA family protein [Bacteroidales bacterium]|nr:GtrA family protein [Bacteroidales bacterium]MBD5215366.1 GtrA family protein [Bacteroidales bacterium]MBD5219290.1 GtrA family protein [Bacteroidales bacterium]MDE6437884.1 GtrA family protein [Muribaculaceae bacterium]